MNARLKLVVGVVVAVIVTLGLGWVWGASGRMDVQRALGAAEQRLDLSDARAAILEARVALYNVNFGDASRALEQAKPPLERAQERFRELEQQEAAAHVGTALQHVQDAQRLAGQLDAAANTRAAEALKAIERASPSR
jgi:hypothetical protein